MTDTSDLQAWFQRFSELNGLDRYILVNGHAIRCDDLHEWSTWMADHSDQRIVAVDKNEGDGPDGTRVSTVFLGFNIRPYEEPPIVFETMVFGGVLDGTTRRYSTLVDAMAGHQAMCKRVMETER